MLLVGRDKFQYVRFSENSSEVGEDAYLECMVLQSCFIHVLGLEPADFGSRLPAMMDLRYKSQLYLFCSHFRFKGPGIVLII